MLKPIKPVGRKLYEWPAAFRRLCVETGLEAYSVLAFGPAAFRRLCVETRLYLDLNSNAIPAAFRRLCVETHYADIRKAFHRPSRLQEAVC